MDGPTDMTFVCMKLQDNGELSGAPMSSCHARGVVDPPTTVNGQRVLGTFAFIPNATRSELAVADMETGRLLDLSPAAPGFGTLPVGGDPESIASSQDGCWVVTANRTTCNLTMIDPSRLLAPTFAQGSVPATPVTQTDAGANTISDNARTISRIETSSGSRLHSRVGEIAFLPADSSAGTCADRTQKVVATFPGCDMVAIMALSFADSAARIESAYYVRPDGVQPAGGDPICPIDCAASDAGSDDGGVAEATGAQADGGGAPDGGASPQNGSVQLQPLALVPDGSRVYVAGLHDRFITSLDIDSGSLTRPSRFALAPVEVRDGVPAYPSGVSRLRLGVDPYATATTQDGRTVQGRFLDARGGAFLYAFAKDDSIRVVDITPATPVECDVNLVITGAPVEDPNATGATIADLERQVITDLASSPCLPVGSPPRRRALAQGPGLRVPTFTSPDSPPPLPRDIAFAELRPVQGDGNVHSLSGQFAFLLASDGQVYVVNLAPDNEPYTATHSFRAVRDLSKPERTPLSLSIAPQRAVVVADQAFAVTANFAAGQGPMINAFSSDNSTPSSWFGFPDSYLTTKLTNAALAPTVDNWNQLPPNDPNYIVSRVWSVIWEGLVPQTDRETGIVKSAGAGSVASSAGELVDTGADFCSSGVRPGDVLMFSGCVQDSDCQPDNLFSCQVRVSGGRGLCLPRDSAKTQTLAANPRCAQFLGSRLRYEISEVGPTHLALNLKLDDVPKTTLNPCTTDAECRPDAEHGSLTAPDAGPSAAFRCLELRPQERRCVKTCEADTDCRPGNFCYQVPGLAPPFDTQKMCVQAPPLDNTCFAQPMTSYSVRAGNSYMVYGSSLPRVRDQIASKDGKTCTSVTTNNIELVNRIPLAAPRCPDAFAASLTGAGNPITQVSAFSLPAGDNPCLYTQPSSTDATRPTILAFYENPQIRFVLADLEQYAGDLVSIQFTFQSIYGYSPSTVPMPRYEIQLTLPIRILTGPTMTPESPIRSNAANPFSYPYIYVVDQGRTALTPGSRGQVVRINPREGGNELATFDTAISGGSPFQLQ
jgi:hypothetical protein